MITALVALALAVGWFANDAIKDDQISTDRFCKVYEPPVPDTTEEAIGIVNDYEAFMRKVERMNTSYECICLGLEDAFCQKQN